MIKKYYIRPLLIATIIIMASSFFTLPYYVSKPGMAKELHPIIKVENGYEETGTFMLTTVRMGKANIYSYLLAKVSKYQEIYPEKLIKGEDESEEEYNTRQLHLMEGSKLNAIEVAYKKAGIPVDFHYKGVYVLNIFPEMPADGKLLPGDRIYEVDGKGFDSSDLFIDYVKNKNVGDSIQLTIERKEKVKKLNIPIATYPKKASIKGIGIELVDDKEIIVKPAVKVNTDEIGGPSAGLMFTLEIYNQLTKEDFTKGYQIAGTGTISSDGTVGPIGGIEQKIVAADKVGAEIFFAPNEKGAADSNYKAAVKTAKDIHTKMKIIPVDTFEDAVAYLEKLPIKR
ncbi:SepM family pheromone-processing serine protease [Bacillus sp. CGMCC 1.16607]|uniref:SepM family pheromone-processing serine protease n=1 Tax=Bacillus sp. CGMCC 1.16607 TaxID=3351842 RepID=UPI003632C87A